MYQQTLYSVITPVKKNTISRLNRSKKWKYGYNKEHDIVVISKTCLLYTSPSPRDRTRSRMPSSA